MILLSSALLAGASPRARASESKNSSSGSSNSSGSSKSSDSDSSNGSKDSSNSSKDSSNNSQASSKDSDNSTQNSPKRTSDWSSQGTSDWSTKSRGGQVFSVALAVVVVGASVIGAVGASRSRADRARPAAVALAAYLRQHHALLTHDVALASGPIFDAWAHDLRLGRHDRRSLERSLDGSADQGLLLDALDGPIDEDRARRFAAAFLRATARAIGPDRTRALVMRADAAADAAHDGDG
jgi:DNA mismatch repair ATPase MutL